MTCGLRSRHTPLFSSRARTSRTRRFRPGKTSPRPETRATGAAAPAAQTPRVGVRPGSARRSSRASRPTRLYVAHQGRSLAVKAQDPRNVQPVEPEGEPARDRPEEASGARRRAERRARRRRSFRRSSRRSFRRRRRNARPGTSPGRAASLRRRRRTSPGAGTSSKREAARPSRRRALRPARGRGPTIRRRLGTKRSSRIRSGRRRARLGLVRPSNASPTTTRRARRERARRRSPDETPRSR